MLVEIIQANALKILLIIGTAFTFYWLWHYKEKLHIKWYSALIIAVAHTIFGVFSVCVFAFIESGFNPKSLGNMSLFGGVFFMPLFYYVLAKILHQKVSDVFDVCTNCMLFTLMCSRFNCLTKGCCHGNEILHTGFRWPTRELEIIFYIILMIVIARKLKYKQTSGYIYPMYMIVYGGFRFLTEGFRFYEGTSIFHIAHFWALIALCLGVSIYVEIQKRSKIKMRRKNK